MDPVVLGVILFVGIVGLPGYLYLLSKFAQVGRMAGTRWFTQHCNSERKENGTSSGEAE